MQESNRNSYSKDQQDNLIPNEFTKDRSSALTALNKKAGQRNSKNTKRSQNKKCRKRKDELSEAQLETLSRNKINKIRPKIKTIKNVWQEGLIGVWSTHLALKNPTSFLVSTFGEGVILVENNAMKYSARLPDDLRTVTDVVYFPPLNCYFMASRYQLYRKDIDGNPPYFFMEVKCGTRPGGCLRYSHISGRLFINKDHMTISVINPKTKKIEVHWEKTVGENIKDFKLFRRTRTE